MIEDGKLKKLLNIDTILNYHRLSMFHKKKIAGKIRQIPVHIRGNPNFKVSPVKHIKQDLDALMYQYNKFIKNKKTPLKETIKFAAFFHNEFQHIHPFIDGNSRVTRLITFHLLQYKDIPILDLPLGLLDEYLKKTKSSRTRNDKELMLALEKVILFNLKKINKKLEE